MNCRGILAGCAGRASTGGFETRPYKRRPPGWPILEALAIIAAALFFLTAVTDLWATLSSALATCLPT